MIEAAALVIGTTTTALIALAILNKNQRSITTKSFVGLAIGLIGWSITTYFSLHTSTGLQTLHWIRWIMFFVVIQNTSFFLLVHVFPDSQSDILHKKRYIAAIIYSLITAVAAASPLLFPTFKSGAPQPGPGMALFLPHALIFAVGGIIALIIRYRRARGLKRAQLQYFLAGTLLMFTLVPIVNFVIPVVFKTNRFVALSPLFPIIFSGLIGYAIVTKQLFNLRAAVARSVAYTLTVVSLAAAYVVSAFIASSFLFGLRSVNVQAQITYIPLALLLASSFQLVKGKFNHLTNKFFYQDAYDAQVLLNKINKVLVATVELDDLLSKSLLLIQDALKVEFCLAVVVPLGSEKLRVVGATKKSLPDDVVIAAHTRVSHVKRRRVIIADYLGPDETGLSEILNENDIAVVARLGGGGRTGEKRLGHIMLGAKKSGNPFDKQDIRMVETVANELVIAIENALHFEEIQRFNVTLQQKVDEATRRLRESNRKLKLLDETKDDFISMASHQLRTPLTSVKGYISLVLDGDAGPIKSSQRKLLDQAFTSSQRMVYLIADLLNVSRLKTGKFIIEPMPVNLADIVQDEVNQLTETAGSRSLELTYHRPAHFPVLNLDETKTRQVIMNFIDNAIYYTPAGGHIEVLLLETPKTIELRVVDDGIGVPKAMQHHLFTKFYRADNAQKARPDGTGLGLFMAKKVIIAQGGAIIFNSQEGHGSTFGFTLPKVALAADQKSTSAA